MKRKILNSETVHSKKLHTALSLCAANYGPQEDSTAIFINQFRRRRDIGAPAYMMKTPRQSSSWRARTQTYKSDLGHYGAGSLALKVSKLDRGLPIRFPVSFQITRSVSDHVFPVESLCSLLDHVTAFTRALFRLGINWLLSGAARVE